MQDVLVRCTDQFRIGGEAVLRLGHADRQAAISGLFHPLQGGAHIVRRLHPFGAVDLAGNRFDLLQQGSFVAVERLELGWLGLV